MSDPSPPSGAPPAPVPAAIPPSAGHAAALVAAVIQRPDLWWTAMGELRRLAPRLWWRTPPHLPLPDRRLWEFRMVTAYGRPDAVPDRADVVAFLEWCRATADTGPPRAGGRG